MSFGLGLSGYIPIVYYIAGIVVLVATLVYRREYGLYYLIPLIPGIIVREKLKVFPFGKDVVDIFILVLLVSILVKPGEKRRVDTTLNWMVVIMVGMAYLGLWIGSFKLGLPYPTLSEERFLEWKNFVIMPILYFIVLRTITNKKQMMIVVALMVLTVLMMNRYWYSTYRFYKTFHFSYSQRISAGFSYLGENELAAFFAMCLLFMVAMVLCLRKWPFKAALLGAIAADGYCIIYLFSRGAYMAVAAGLTFFGFLLDRRILIGLVVVFLAYPYILPQSMIDRIEMSETEEGTDPSIQGRLDMWGHAFNNILANPLIGEGYGSTQYLGFGSGSHEHRRDVHNGYLEVLMESGLLGALCFFVIFYRAGIKGLQLFRATEDPFFRGIGVGLVGMIIASLLTNLTSETWHYLAVMGYFWILLAMVVIAQDVVEGEKAETAPVAAPTREADETKDAPPAKQPAGEAAGQAR